MVDFKKLSRSRKGTPPKQAAEARMRGRTRTAPAARRGPPPRPGRRPSAPRRGEAFVQADHTGALFENENKETDSHPDYLGSVTVEGVKYWVSGWENTSRNGRRYIGIRLKEVEEQQPPADEDVPF